MNEEVDQETNQEESLDFEALLTRFWNTDTGQEDFLNLRVSGFVNRRNPFSSGVGRLVSRKPKRLILMIGVPVVFGNWRCPWNLSLGHVGSPGGAPIKG